MPYMVMQLPPTVRVFSVHLRQQQVQQLLVLETTSLLTTHFSTEAAEHLLPTMPGFMVLVQLPQLLVVCS
jgi:hypothetical protein